MAKNIAPDLAQSYTLSSLYRLRWDQCCAYLYGNQTPGQHLGVSEDPATYTGKRKRVQPNQLYNLRRHITAVLVTDYPAIAAIPATDSPDDIAKSRASETAIRYYWQQAKIREVLRTAIQWMVDTGTCALHTYYHTGKKSVVTEAVIPYDLRFEPYARTPDESEWIGVSKYVTMEDLVAAYPEHEEELRTKATPATQVYGIGPQSHPMHRYEMIDVYFRDGTHQVYSGGIMLWEGMTPGGRVPVQVIRYTEVSGYLWGLGLLEPLLGMQDLYNEARTQIRANMRLVGNPRILTPEDGDIKAGAFTDRPGERITHKPGFQPSYMSPPPLPDYLTSEPARILSEMYDISGTYGTSLGKRTTGVSSGVAIQQTQQNATQQLQITQDAVENAVKEMAMDVLVLMKEYYTEGKMVRMLDRSGKLVWETLDSTRLQEDPEIFLEAGSLFRTEAQDRDNRTMQLFQSGLLTADQAKKNLSYRLEPLQITDQLAGLRYATEVLDTIKALGAEKIVTFKPKSTDDLEALEQVFSSFMRQPEYYALPAMTQEAIDMAHDAILLTKLNPQGMLPQIPGPDGMPQDPMGGKVAPGAGLPKPPNSPGAMAPETDALEGASV